MFRLGGWLAILLSAAAAMGANVDFDARFKWFGTANALPPEDATRQQLGTPLYNHGLDFRALFRARPSDASPFRFIADYSVIYIGGDGAAGIQSPIDQTPTEDSSRLFDLTWTISEGSRHDAFHRFDRLAVEYRKASWGVTVGRQAVSWGSGFVFQPMDLFSPFSPTTVDRDYKPGDDIVLIEKLFDGGSDLQLLAVGRRNDSGDADVDESSFAAKWYGLLGVSEIELMVGRHYVDDVFGFTFRTPIGGAMLRTDIIGTHLDDDGWRISGIVNIDYSFPIAGRSSYAFFEYFHNDFGVSTLPPNPLLLPQPLLDRLTRGELFNFMRDYTAVGLNHEWHPLWRQSISLLTNWQDKSNLVQTTLSYEPSDHTRLELGVIAVLGDAGDEFGGIPVAPGLTTGGGTRGFVRFVYYW